mgnify:CR=1 FL=1
MDHIRRETDKIASARARHSTDPQDYQNLPPRLAVMAKQFPDGFQIATHSHPRDQVIYGISGVMRIETLEGAWIVPPDRALLLPAGMDHSVDVRGSVEMRTLYITPTKPAGIKVLAVSPLMRELISALAQEPMDYSGNNRAEQIAELISMELSRASALPLNIPLPQDVRLQQVCQKVLNDPSIKLTLEEWAGLAAISSKTLARLCKKELGMSFSVWRRRIRFAKALEMLGQNHPIKRIAQECGYKSSSAFTYAFRQQFGETPKAFPAFRIQAD